MAESLKQKVATPPGYVIDGGHASRQHEEEVEQDDEFFAASLPSEAQMTPQQKQMLAIARVASEGMGRTLMVQVAKRAAAEAVSVIVVKYDDKFCLR